MAECGAEGDALEFPPDQGVAVGLTSMLHRYLNHERFTLAAIDDVIARGRQSDWFDQRRHQGVSTDFPPFRIIVRVIRRSFGPSIRTERRRCTMPPPRVPWMRWPFSLSAGRT